VKYGFKEIENILKEVSPLNKVFEFDEDAVHN